MTDTKSEIEKSYGDIRDDRGVSDMTSFIEIRGRSVKTRGVTLIDVRQRKSFIV